LVGARTKLSQVIDELPPWHVRREDVLCGWEHKGKVMRLLNERFANHQPPQIDGVKLHMGAAWVLILPDPETPFFHIVAEGQNGNEAAQLSAEYADLVRQLQNN
jgi:mannose-1-phosphate guanylyltransferase/phosphomannomutase